MRNSEFDPMLFIYYNSIMENEEMLLQSLSTFLNNVGSSREALKAHTIPDQTLGEFLDGLRTEQASVRKSIHTILQTDTVVSENNPRDMPLALFVEAAVPVERRLRRKIERMKKKGPS